MTAGSRATVVVANPDQTVCEVLARVIEAGGHEVIRVTDPAGVVEAVASSGAQGAVLDLAGSTVSALQAIRSHASPAGSACRVVVISTGPANAHLAWQANADGVLTRPMTSDALRAELDAALARAEPDRLAARAAGLAAAG